MVSYPTPSAWGYSNPPSPTNSPPIERVKELASVAAHFFSGKRWHRTFFIVDSKYHFHHEDAGNEAATSTSLAP